jgi:hypothetical protein
MSMLERMESAALQLAVTRQRTLQAHGFSCEPPFPKPSLLAGSI